MNEPAVLGLDIGGREPKVRPQRRRGDVLPFPLWKHPDRLTAQLVEIRERMPPHDLLAVTMTGELCDCFANKREGVLAILRSAEAAAVGTPLVVWTNRAELVEPAQVRDDPRSAAAANWLALAHLAVRIAGGEPSLLIDVGSTTTDLVYLDPVPRLRFVTDRKRLSSGELVYTGLRRTPVCAVLGMGVAAELFATMLDVYLMLGRLPDDSADLDTADGRPATRAHAHARLARLWCADADEVSLTEIETLARRAMDVQARCVRDAIDKVLTGHPSPRQVILSGSGEALGRNVLATHAALCALPVVSLAERLGPALSEAACAYAIAFLAAEQARRWKP